MPLPVPEPLPPEPAPAIAAAPDATPPAAQPELFPELPPPPPPPTSAAAMEEHRHPLRFVWQMDPEGRFTIDSAEFLTIMGPRTAALIGQPWPFIASVTHLDPEAQVARAIATRATWSGVSVAWRVDGSDERLAVELSGLPVFDRERAYRGYRGFGVCRDVARLERDCARTRRRAGRRSAAGRDGAAHHHIVGRPAGGRAGPDAGRTLRLQRALAPAHADASTKPMRARS